MWDKIRCFFGFHDWDLFETMQGFRWVCRRCNKVGDRWNGKF